MLKQIIIGGIVGGITLFIWGFISWVVLTWHFDTIRQDEGIHAVVENITEHLPESGAYYFPPMTVAHQTQEGGEEAWLELHRSMPHGYIMLQTEPGEAMPPMTLATRVCRRFRRGNDGLALTGCCTAKLTKLQIKSGICCFPRGVYGDLMLCRGRYFPQLPTSIHCWTGSRHCNRVVPHRHHNRGGSQTSFH